MKVLVVNNDFRVYWKGRLLFLKKYLADRDIELFALELFGKGSPYSFDSYDNKEIWWSCLFTNKSSEELSKTEIKKEVFAALDEINPDVIIASPIVLFAGALSMRWAKKNKKKFVMYDDAKPWQFKRNVVVQWVKDTIINQSDGFWLPSAEYAAEYSKLNTKKMVLFYGFNCIDNNRFKQSQKNELNHCSIICVARLVPIKNIDNLLMAWQIVEQNNKDYQLQIVGNGPEYQKLNELSGRLNLTRVHFLGTVDNSKLPGYYYNSDAFILPSLSETWGLVVNEAMAAGLPVLLSNKINACQGLLEENVNGLSFGPQNIAEIAAAILKYINLDTNDKRLMADNAIATINKMNYENMGESLYHALLKIGPMPFKRPGLQAWLMINLWDGKDDHTAWDKLN